MEIICTLFELLAPSKAILTELVETFLHFEAATLTIVCISDV